MLNFRRRLQPLSQVAPVILKGARAFAFEYGLLDDGTAWIRTPNEKLFRVPREAAQILLKLQEGASYEEVLKSYDVPEADLQRILWILSQNGAIVEPGAGKITQAQPKPDVSLTPFLWLALGALAIQIPFLLSQPVPFRVHTRADAWIVTGFALACVFLHEACHYVASLPYFKPKKFGFTLLLFFPAVFVDANEAWVCPRNARMLIASAGNLFDLCANAAACVLAWSNPALLKWVGPFLMLQYFRLTINANPLWGDGYWVLSDTTKIPNLRKRAMESLFKFKPHWLSLYGLCSFLLMGYGLFILTRFVFALLGMLVKGLF